MHSKCIIGIHTLLILLFAGTVQAANVAKIGVIDLQEILKKSDAGKAAQDEINALGNRLKEDFDAKQAEIEQMKKNLERDAYVMDREKIEDKEREIRLKINDIQSLQRRYTEELKEFEVRLIRRIHQEMMEVVNEMGKKEGYLLIIERSSALYYPNTIDVTDKLIKLYNESWKSKSKK